MIPKSRTQVVHLLIIHPSVNEAEKINSQLRTAGFAPRMHHVQDFEAAQSTIVQRELDLIIASADMDTVSIKSLDTEVSNEGKRIPIIALSAESTTDKIVELMEAGAQDLVVDQKLDHLLQVFRRELESLESWRGLKRCQQDYQESERRNRMLLDSSREPIAYVHQGMHIYANPSYFSQFGFDAFEDVEGLPLMDLVSGRDEQKKLKEFLKHLEDKGDLELKLRRHGSDVPFGARISFSPATMDGEPCSQVTVQDLSVSDTRELEEQVNYLQQRDVLTGLYNRQYFFEQLQRAYNAAVSGERRSALLHLELDDFDELKKKVGVANSDLLLRDVGKIIENQLEPEDIAARFDAASFTVLKQGGNTEALQSLNQQLLRAIEDHIFEIGDVSLSATAHLGFTLLDANAPDAQEIMDRAERASGEAVAKGGNTFVRFLPKAGEMTQREQDQKWANRITKALQDNGFQLYFQPIVSVNGESGKRYEVLIRMIDEEGGELIEPSQFLPAAERLQMGRGIDRWVIERCLKLVSERWHQGEELRLFVKITTGTLSDGKILPWLSERFKHYRLPGEYIAFQIKESAVVTHVAEAKAFAQALNQLNTGLVVEDFGTGVNSVQLFKHVNAGLIKLSCSFISDLANQPRNQESVKTLIRSIHDHAKEVIAPCVEDPYSLSLLWGMDINYIQGNFVQPPSEWLDYPFETE